jgi:hypothetical protein
MVNNGYLDKASGVSYSLENIILEDNPTDAKEEDMTKIAKKNGDTLEAAENEKPKGYKKYTFSCSTQMPGRISFDIITNNDSCITKMKYNMFQNEKYVTGQLYKIDFGTLVIEGVYSTPSGDKTPSDDKISIIVFKNATLNFNEHISQNTIRFDGVVISGGGRYPRTKKYRKRKHARRTKRRHGRKRKI